MPKRFDQSVSEITVFDSCTLICWCRRIASSRPTPAKITLQIYEPTFSLKSPVLTSKKNMRKAHVQWLIPAAGAGWTSKPWATKVSQSEPKVCSKSCKGFMLEKDPDERNRWPQYIFKYCNRYIQIFHIWLTIYDYNYIITHISNIYYTVMSYLITQHHHP